MIMKSHLNSCQNIKDINMDTLSSSIDNILITDSLSSPDELVALYNNGLNSILNSLAPVKTRYVTFSQTAPWFTPECWIMKAKGQQLEQLYRKTDLTILKEMHKTHILLYKDSVAIIKSMYYASLICSKEGNIKTLFSLVNTSLQPPGSLLPDMYATDTCNSLIQWKKITSTSVVIPHSLLWNFP